MDLSSERILLTGGAGFLGRHVHAELRRVGVPDAQIVIPRQMSSGSLPWRGRRW
jgi:nucleoside-diphosphate-sugar epimerase